MKRQIVVTGTFVGFHKWPEAPDEVSYLRELHRHLFTYKVYFPVSHNDRELEFHIQKEKVAKHIYDIQGSQDVYKWSCETWAETLLSFTAASRVEIWEDGECGSIVECESYVGEGETVRKMVEKELQSQQRTGEILHEGSIAPFWKRWFSVV